MSFDKAFAATTAFEGGHTIVDGHETYMGIDRNQHPEWGGWSIIDTARRRGESLERRGGPGLAGPCVLPVKVLPMPEELFKAATTYATPRRRNHEF
ncbi:MAG: hypothetical protein LBD10_14685 [Desulfobulbus sp.]|jgi:hypothetical protein|uniref:hypothetical protein n=1 Tax=Desulfobulbus sp. TaxID=895 RepID=UPI00284AFBA1|nr:hypothetical protein [Desulfobulbus sp.]MDR2551434.1 hypothetical protein [Desulfobulbus sp.]